MNGIAIGFLLLLISLLFAPQPILAQGESNDFPLQLQNSYDGNYCFTSGGVSLHDSPTGIFDVNVPGTPAAAFIYWSGRGGINKAVGDDTLQLIHNDGVEQTILAQNALHGASAQRGHQWFTYEAPLDLSLVQEGANGYKVSGLDITSTIHGVGISVVYEDVVNCQDQEVSLLFGNDILYRPSPPYQPNDIRETVVTCVDFAPADVERKMDFQLFVGGVERPERQDAIWYQTGSGESKPESLVGSPDAIALQEALRGLNGLEFDNYDTLVQDPNNQITVLPGQSWACFQIQSPPGGTSADHTLGISATWLTLAVRIGQPVEPPPIGLLAAGRADSASWSYTVVNDGTVALENVRLYVGNIGEIQCQNDPITLAVGERIKCFPPAGTNIAYEASVAWVLADPVGGGSTVIMWISAQNLPY